MTGRRQLRGDVLGVLLEPLTARGVRVRRMSDSHATVQLPGRRAAYDVRVAEDFTTVTVGGAFGTVGPYSLAQDGVETRLCQDLIVDAVAEREDALARR